jgi:hypothetical protein
MAFAKTVHNDAQSLIDLVDSVSCTFQMPKHLLESACELPCKRHACSTCIHNRIQNDCGNQLRCVYCNDIHLIDPQFYQSNITNPHIANKISANAELIHGYYVNELKTELEKTKGDKNSSFFHFHIAFNFYSSIKSDSARRTRHLTEGECSLRTKF